jgi:acyl carrier protein
MMETVLENNSEEQLLAVLLGVLKEQLGESIGPERYDADLTEVGVDSLMALEIAHRLEDELKIVIDDRDALGFRTVNAIYSSLRRTVAQSSTRGSSNP